MHFSRKRTNVPAKIFGVGGKEGKTVCWSGMCEPGWCQIIKMGAVKLKDGNKASRSTVTNMSMINPIKLPRNRSCLEVSSNLVYPAFIFVYLNNSYIALALSPKNYKSGVILTL